MMTASTLTPPPYPRREEAEEAELGFRDKLPIDDQVDDDRLVREEAVEAFRLCPAPPIKSGTRDEEIEDVDIMVPRELEATDEAILPSARRRRLSSLRSSRRRSARARRR